MNITVSQRGEVSIAAILGEIDGKTAPLAQAQLMPILEATNKVVLDMSSVSYLSSAGLRMLLVLYRQATARSGKVALEGLSEEIKDTMSMTGFLGFFEVSDTLDAGLLSLA